jgi:hypothetical protein
MAEKTRNFTGKTFFTLPRGRRLWLLRLIVVFWILQLAWLGWLLREEIVDIPRRVGSLSWGEAVRQEDPFYCWLAQLDQVIPPDVTYIFLDNYEAGKEIEARYHLFPRRHVLIGPEAPPSLLFHLIRHEQPSYLLVREPTLRLRPGLKAALAAKALEPLPAPGPGLAFRVKPDRIAGGFYD